jgi:hypothetical protein
VLKGGDLRQCLSGVGLGVLGGDHASGQTPVNVCRGARPVVQLIVAGDPPNLAGGEVRALGEREAHWLIADGVSLQGGGSPATIPVGGLPTVTLGTALIIIVGIHQVVVLAIQEAVVVLGALVGAVGGGAGHGSFRLN